MQVIWLVRVSSIFRFATSNIGITLVSVILNGTEIIAARFAC